MIDPTPTPIEREVVGCFPTPWGCLPLTEGISQGTLLLLVGGLVFLSFFVYLGLRIYRNLKKVNVQTSNDHSTNLRDDITAIHTDLKAFRTEVSSRIDGIDGRLDGIDGRLNKGK